MSRIDAVASVQWPNSNGLLHAPVVNWKFDTGN